MGGMRIGMLPLGGGARRPHTSHILTEQQQPVPVPPSPSVRTVPPPRPPLPPQHQDSDLDIDNSLSASISASEDGVKVEAEESEIEIEEVPPPPPPGRHSVRLLTRTVCRRELPSISSTSLEFSDGPDLSLSRTDAASAIQTSPLPHPPPSPRPSIPPPQPIPVPVPAAERQLSSDELMAVWGRVGVQICEVATTLHDKSKRALVGEGTYEGSVNAVLAEVPNAALLPLVSSSSESEYGYLKWVSEILPGDVVELRDARLKGHKGLQAYN